MSKKNVDVINLILKESKAYTSLEVIENFIKERKSLENLPVQPLYTTFKNLPIEIKSHAMSLLSKEQREVFYDLDLWKKDILDIHSFTDMVKTISKSPDESLRLEFSKSSELALFLKGRFNIWTFDVEDPLYPDHDYYFLTEDNLLLVEYDDECDIVDEVKQLIKDLYTDLGVEKAYQYLFTIVSDGFMNQSEAEYARKKERLRHFGFVDYIDALQITNSLPSLGHVDLFIKNQTKLSTDIDEKEKVQTLHANSLIAFEEKDLNISKELIKIEDDKRYDFLHFNFIRLINANLENHNALKDGALTMTRIGKGVRNTLELGFDYVMNKRSFSSEESVFDYFDFVELYKVGTSLVSIIQKRVKKELASFELDGPEDKFLGNHFESFLDGLFSEEVKAFDNGHMEPVISLSSYNKLNELSETLVTFLPFISTFKSNLMSLLAEGQINDDYYLNYDSESIDLEAILISLLINFTLGKNDQNSPKMGITTKEYKEFYGNYFELDKLNSDKLRPMAKSFVDKFGLSEVNNIEGYLLQIIADQMNGYQMESLEDHEFKHIGGPIVLNNLS
ncbi:MAG: DUF6178 family protein [Bdellovibrionota bacterium]|nr:DUF6178 family protein [Bdellovibrionota bacterium]